MTHYEWGIRSTRFGYGQDYVDGKGSVKILFFPPRELGEKSDEQIIAELSRHVATFGPHEKAQIVKRQVEEWEDIEANMDNVVEGWF